MDYVHGMRAPYSLAVPTSSEEHSPVRSFGYIVKALYADGSGRQVSQGHDEHDEVLVHAKELVERGVMSDVLIIVNDHRRHVVHVLLGVQWFCEEQLNAQFPGWRHHHHIPPDEEIPDVPIIEQALEEEESDVGVETLDMEAA